MLWRIGKAISDAIICEQGLLREGRRVAELVRDRSLVPEEILGFRRV